MTRAGAKLARANAPVAKATRMGRCSSVGLVGPVLRVVIRFMGESGAADAPMKFTRITSDPRQMGGMPCIRGLRIPVATVVGMIADGMTEDEILSAYPDLDGDDIHEALRNAGRMA